MHNRLSPIAASLAVNILFRNNDHRLQPRGPEGGCHGDIAGVATSSDEHPTLTPLVVARIEGPPAVTQVDLHPGRKVHRQIARRNVDLWQVTKDIASGNVECAAERNCEVGEVPAHPVAAAVN